MAIAIADNRVLRALPGLEDTETLVGAPVVPREIDATVETGRVERADAAPPLRIARLAETMVLSEVYTFPIHF